MKTKNFLLKSAKNLKIEDELDFESDFTEELEIEIIPHPTITPYYIEGEKGSKMIESVPLFLRTITYNCDTGKTKTEICTLSNRHQFILDTSEVPLLPFIDGIPYVANEQEQIRYINMYRENPSMAHCFIKKAEIISLKDYNDFYLKTGCV